MAARAYRSELRWSQADRTRARVLAATGDALMEVGYTRTDGSRALTAKTPPERGLR